MPKGYATRQVYIPAGEQDMLSFLDGLEHRSQWVRDAIRLKRATEGTTPPWLPVVERVVRRVVREELARLGGVQFSGSGQDGKEELDQTDEIASFMSKVSFGG